MITIIWYRNILTFNHKLDKSHVFEAKNVILVILVTFCSN
jgi:hypothetical protein